MAALKAAKSDELSDAMNDELEDALDEMRTALGSAYAYADDTDALKDALDNGKTVVELDTECTERYTVTTGTAIASNSLTIIGTEDTTLYFDNDIANMYAKELTVVGCKIPQSGKKWGYHVPLGHWNTQSGYTYTFINCTLEGNGSTGFYINALDGCKYVITGCTFEGNFGGECPIVIQNNVGTYEVVVTDCTFTNIPADAYIGYWAEGSNSWASEAGFTLTTDVANANIVTLPR